MSVFFWTCSAGGGGNNAPRMEKIKQKNQKLKHERATRIKKDEQRKKERPPQVAAGAEEPKQRVEEPNGNRESFGGMHPSRSARMHIS